MKTLTISFILIISMFACRVNKKTATQIRIKEQEKHQKKHPCPQQDCN